jgi:hypothetical protein
MIANNKLNEGLDELRRLLAVADRDAEQPSHRKRLSAIGWAIDELVWWQVHDGRCERDFLAQTRAIRNRLDLFANEVMCKPSRELLAEAYAAVESIEKWNLA